MSYLQTNLSHKAFIQTYDLRELTPQEASIILALLVQQLHMLKDSTYDRMIRSLIDQLILTLSPIHNPAELLNPTTPPKS